MEFRLLRKPNMAIAQLFVMLSLPIITSVCFDKLSKNILFYGSILYTTK